MPDRDVSAAHIPMAKIMPPKTRVPIITCAKVIGWSQFTALLPAIAIIAAPANSRAEAHQLAITIASDTLVLPYWMT